ncbi:MAG: hypothetical protein ACK5Q5_03095, partial [Planctomycetaceae bacterium]
MSLRMCLPSRAGGRLVLLVATVFVSLQGWSIAFPQSSRSGSSYLRRMKQQQQAQMEAIKKKEIALLQAQHQAAQQKLEQAQPRLEAAQGEIRSAQSQMESTKQAVDTDEGEARALHRRLQEVEERVLANRPQDAPDVVAADEVHKLQRQLDARMHDVLQLPRTESAETESEKTRQSELLHLTSEQKSKLKADDEYGKLSEQLSSKTKELQKLRQAALESDKDWSSANTAWKSAQEKLSSSEAEHRKATGANALARKSLKA